MRCLIRTSTTREPIATTSTYDSERRPLTTLYDAVSNVLSATNGLGVVTNYSYDALNRQTARLDAYGTPLQRTTTMAYDSDDNVTASIDALGNRTTYGYDALNRRVTVQDAGGGVATTAYDANDNVTALTDPLVHATTHAYDVLNRRTQTTDARGGIVTFVYDANNDLLSLTDPVNNLTQWLYDALDRKAQETDPLGYSAIYAYDAADRMISATDRAGQRIAYAYDLLNRETGETWYNAGGTAVNTLTFTYDANNNLLTAANNTATSTMAYDALDRKTAAQDPFGAALTYAYDAADNRTQMQDSFGAATTRVYDVLNRTTTMTFGGTGQTPLREDFTYTARDQVASQSRYSDLAGTATVGSSTYGYDAVGRLTTLQHQNGAGANIASYTNSYDLASRITSEILNGGAPTTYAYDATNELTSDGVATYSYDLNGNRTMTGYTTGPANELTSDGTWGYYYDLNGNRVRKANPSTGEAWSYGYDNRNRLVSAQDVTSAGVQSQATYVYDALGKRIEKDVTQSGVTTTTRFAYDGSQIWADLNSSNALVTRYMHGQRILELLAQVSGGGTAAWVLADRMGTVRAVVDATGAVLDVITYDGYGNVTNETNPSNGGQYKYSGYRLDIEIAWYRPDLSTGRYYDPATGTWSGRDPRGFGAGDENLLRYVWNNPANSTDPLAENVKKQYSRPSGTEPPFETSLIDITLVVDTSDCKGTGKECEGKVKISLKYSTTLTLPDKKEREQYAKAGLGYGLEYGDDFNPLKLKDDMVTLAPEKDTALGEIPCAKGDKSGTVHVKKKDPLAPLPQHDIRFKVEISCCGQIENETVDAINRMFGSGAGEGKPQPFKGIDVEGHYPEKGKEKP